MCYVSSTISQSRRPVWSVRELENVNTTDVSNKLITAVLWYPSTEHPTYMTWRCRRPRERARRVQAPGRAADH